MNISSTSHHHKQTLPSILSTKLNNLTIPSQSTDQDFDFADVFGPNSSSSLNPNSLFIGDPQIIHNRSHSFIGPSPRYTLSKSLPFHQEFDPESSGEDEDEDLVKVDKVLEDGCGDEEKGGDVSCKIGPGDFEIMRVIGKGSFGKVFQVRRKDKMSVNDDGIYAMKVMRKDTIIKNNHVDYMRAERDILTKVVHPFIVQLRYSFQVLDFG